MSDATAIALQRSLSDVVAEYDEKVAAVGETIAAFEKAGVTLKTAATVGGTWGNSQINTGSVYEREIKGSLLKSAWRHVYNGLNIEQIAPAKDKRLFDQQLADPAPFTLDNIRATFGHYIADPRAHILRGLAEVFSDLDPAFKSHDKVKIGVKGLPKRVIIRERRRIFRMGPRQGARHAERSRRMSAQASCRIRRIKRPMERRKRAA